MRGCWLENIAQTENNENEIKYNEGGLRVVLVFLWVINENEIKYNEGGLRVGVKSTEGYAWMLIGKYCTNRK